MKTGILAESLTTLLCVLEMATECTPKAKRGLKLAVTPAGDPRKESAQQLSRTTGAPLTHEEMRMALRVLEMVETERSWRRHKNFKSVTDRVAHMVQVGAAKLRSLRKFVGEHGELPLEEDTSKRGRKPPDLRSDRFVVML